MGNPSHNYMQNKLFNRFALISCRRGLNINGTVPFPPVDATDNLSTCIHPEASIDINLKKANQWANHRHLLSEDTSNLTRAFNGFNITVDILVKYNNLYNNTLKSRDIRVRLTVYHVIRVRLTVSRDACQANCVVQTVGGADGADGADWADDRRGRRSACRRCHVH